MKVRPIERVGYALRLLLQTQLPLNTQYLEIDDYRELIAAIKRLDVRGAPAIGIAAAYGLAMACQKAQRADLEFAGQVAKELKAARPTAVNLAWAVDRVLARLGKENSTVLSDRLECLWSESGAIHEEDRLMCDRIGTYGSVLVAVGSAVLTHCNTGALATGGSGTALAVIYACQGQGKGIHVYVDETRPLLQGARLTVWELVQEGVDVTLICDNMAGALMSQQRVDLVLVGADRIAANGDTANKIGTYSLAVLARHHGIPFYVAAPTSTFDADTPTGADIPLEQRPAEEITEVLGRRIAPLGTKTWSPAFDVTPFALITSFITDAGIRPGGRAA